MERAFDIDTVDFITNLKYKCSYMLYKLNIRML